MYYKDFENLTDGELVKIIIKEKRSEDITDKLFEEFNDIRSIIVDSEVEELKMIKGLGQQRITLLKAVYELSKRLSGYTEISNCKISAPEDAARLLIPEMQFLKQEHFKVIALNTKNRVIGIKTISIGTLDAAIVHSRDVYSYLIKKNAKSCIVAHNHPSGDPNPSNEDINITTKLVEAGKLLGIGLLDHVIIGSSGYVSLKEKALI